MDRYICIHGHFYQPTRNNAWLERVEFQEGAYPYHDWNERITNECYAPNGAARILDEQDRIIQIVNNYTRISFNFGPTLLAWLEQNAPETYQLILDSDRESRQHFSGHGSALAQAYNHIILPLANYRDKYTQVLWAVRDFEHRFQRPPEGMWLPETAVDLKTLDILAQLGLSFTILSPRQASRVRPIGTHAWQDVQGGHIDTTMAYELHLPSGRKINIFFYDDTIARVVAFEDLLNSGERFVRRLADAFAETRNWAQLVHIATDGETFGHHHRFGEMALAYALHYIETHNIARITIYGEYLEKHPPTHDVEILENTAWSCAHGVERWRSNCGDNSGAHPGWNQLWRSPLRQALDWLRDATVARYETMAAQLLKDPWAARNEYIEVVLDHSPHNVQEFLHRQATRALDEGEQLKVLKLLELQRFAMLMYGSDAWFFDEISGVETVQNMQYAARVVQLAEELFDDKLEPYFLELLAAAKSNLPEYGDGRRIYEKLIRPARIDLTRVTAHYAVNSMFEKYNKQDKIYCYTIDVEDRQNFEGGTAKLSLGRVKVTSEITQESAVMSFGVLYLGNHSVNAGVREYQGETAYQTMVQEITGTFRSADFPQVIRLMDKHFLTSTYSLTSLFRDEQRRILSRILESALAEFETAYRGIYEHHYPLMRHLTEADIPPPRAFLSAAEFIINNDLSTLLKSGTLEVARISHLLDEAKMWKINLDTSGLGYLFQQALEKMMARFTAAPSEPSLLKDLVTAVELTRSAPFTMNLSQVQNLYYKMLKTLYPQMQQKAQGEDHSAAEWLSQFQSLGALLSVRVD
ncbi:MAG: DUF3536 domain-containing protein [Chloroflexota bacterium]